MCKKSYVRTCAAIVGYCFSVALCSFAPSAHAGIYITGSYGMDATNVPLEATNTQSASATVDVEIFTFLRIGVSYGSETS